MRCSLNGTMELVHNVAYSLGSSWVTVASTAATFSFQDDLTDQKLTTRVEAPPAAPLGESTAPVGSESVLSAEYRHA